MCPSEAILGLWNTALWSHCQTRGWQPPQGKADQLSPTTVFEFPGSLAAQLPARVSSISGTSTRVKSQAHPSFQSSFTGVCMCHSLV